MMQRLRPRRRVGARAVRKVRHEYRAARGGELKLPMINWSSLYPPLLAVAGL